MQKQIEELQKEIEQYKQANNNLDSDKRMYVRENESLKKSVEQDAKSYKDRIDGLHIAVDETKKEADAARKQAADYKREIDKLADTKTVLNNLMAVLKSPHNDYQKVVNELDDMLKQERSRANALEQELRNIQFDIQRNQFLEGKVQAYEAMFQVKPIKAVQCEGEQETA